MFDVFVKTIRMLVCFCSTMCIFIRLLSAHFNCLMPFYRIPFFSHYAVLFYENGWMQWLLVRYLKVNLNDEILPLSSGLIPPGAAWGDRSPETYESNFFQHNFVQFGKDIRELKPFCCPLFCHSNVVKYTSSLLQSPRCYETWLSNNTEIAPPNLTNWIRPGIPRSMGEIWWGTRRKFPPSFSDEGDIICHVLHFFSLSFAFGEVSKIKVMLVTFFVKNFSC